MPKYSFETFFNHLKRLAMIWVLFEKSRSTQAISMLSRAYGMLVMDQRFFSQPQHPSSHEEQS